MKVELTSDATAWIEAELSSERFSTARDPIGHAIEFAELDRLRAEVEAVEAEGGEFSTDDVLRHMRERLNEIALPHGAT